MKKENVYNIPSDMIIMTRERYEELQMLSNRNKILEHDVKMYSEQILILSEKNRDLKKLIKNYEYEKVK